MITLMKLERSLSSKQLVRSRAAASCPTQPRSRAPSAARAWRGPTAGVTQGGGGGPECTAASPWDWDGLSGGGGRLAEP